MLCERCCLAMAFIFRKPRTPVKSLTSTCPAPGAHSSLATGLSLLPPRADIGDGGRDVGFGPTTEVRRILFLGPRKAPKKDRLAAVSPSATSALIKQLA
jgi:hypothetical protein